MSIAYRAGIPLMDMEFVQFHPTTLKATACSSPKARAAKAHTCNKVGERFMFKYAPKKGELASRDVVSRAEQTEINEGRGVDGCVFLDLRHLGSEKIMERLPQIRELALDATGNDAIDKPMPILPGMHYWMGGIEPTKTARPDSRRLCCRRVRLRQRARREPPRRQLAARNDRVRQSAPRRTRPTT